MKISRKTAVWLLIISALCVFVWIKWDRWFYNPPEEAYRVPESPSRVFLTFGDADGGSSRNVSWMADTVVKPSRLDLVDITAGDSISVEASGETFASRAGVAAYYVARLRNLAPGHTYRYRACTGDMASAWHQFHMAESNKHETSFLFVGDVQASHRCLLGGRISQYRLHSSNYACAYRNRQSRLSEEHSSKT